MYVPRQGEDQQFLTSLFCFWYSLFDCLEFVVPHFSLIWRRHHCQWRATNFDLCSALIAIEQRGFFSVPYLLWHGVSAKSGQLRGPVTITPNAERLAVDLSLPVSTTYVCRGRDSNTFRLRVNALTHCATAVAFFILTEIKQFPMLTFKIIVVVCSISTEFEQHWTSLNNINI